MSVSRITINGREREMGEVALPATLAEVVVALGLKADRVAVELNGTIAPRSSWDMTAVNAGDRLEIVHFVGGGAPAIAPKSASIPSS